MADYIAYTSKSSRLLSVLTSDAYVTPSSYDDIPMSEVKAWQGLWDTGASNSCISPRVVSHLGIHPVGQRRISTANGFAIVKTYIVNIGLPNGVLIPDLFVSCSDLGEHTDVLIGMDIIRLGDFSITNVNGKTTFSYRIPSVKEIDYESGMF